MSTVDRELVEGCGVVVIVPTYNERENIAPLLARLFAAAPKAHALIVDDASPDGTGAEADRLAEGDDQSRVHVLHRQAKDGLGAAYVAGFRWALERDYGVLVEMDADGSHAPEQLPDLLAAMCSRETGQESPGWSSVGLAAPADVTLGSRYVPGGKVLNWPWYRQWLSRGGNVYSKLMLGVAVHDITGGFRAYRRAVLEKIDLSTVASQGYCFQVDLAFRALQVGFRVREVPITFTERESGESKMTGAIVREALLRVTAWGVRNRLGWVPRLRSRS